MDYIRFWGVRGSYATPYPSHIKIGGNTSCVEIRVDDQILICDAGTGIIQLGNELMQQKSSRIHILLTHYHWDHICGLPFFVPAFIPNWKINFFGPGKSDDQVKQFISDQMTPPYFPVETEQWLAEIAYHHISKPLHIGPFKIESFNVHHPGSTYGYRIETKDKVIVYVSDNELAYTSASIAHEIKNGTALNSQELELYQKMHKEETELEINFMKNVDFLIHDAQYTAEDYEKKRGWGHSCYIDTVKSAISANVKNLYLYHHDPYYNDKEISIIHSEAKSIILKEKSETLCHLAKEGDKIIF